VLTIRLGVSWALATLLLVAHGAVMALMLMVEIPWWLKGIAVAALAANLTLQIRQSVLLLTDDSAIALEVSGDNAFIVQTRRGKRVEYDVLGSTFVSARVTVLNLRAVDNGRGRNVVIFADAVNADDFRKLRVWLRWKTGREQLAGGK
jgi:toxin CptA